MSRVLGDAYYVDFRKWPDLPHWEYQVFELGEDAFGRWFCLPQGSVTRRRPEPGTRIHPGTTAKLVPRDGLWMASFNDLPHGVEVYVDVVAETPRFEGRSLTAIDLDLDVVRDRAGATHVWDVDEFEEHQVSLGYPPALVAQAWRTTEALRASIGGRAEPFDRVGAEWLERALARSWPIDPRWLEP